MRKNGNNYCTVGFGDGSDDVEIALDYFPAGSVVLFFFISDVLKSLIVY